MAGQVLVTRQIQGVPIGAVTSTYACIANTSNEYAVTEVTLASGTNTITVPSWAAGVILTPSSSNAVSWNLDSSSGIPLNLTTPTGPIMFPASPPATLVLYAASLFVTTTAIEFI